MLSLQTGTASINLEYVMQILTERQCVWQVLSNMLDWDMEPQSALDAPRWSLYGVDSAEGPVTVERSMCARPTFTSMAPYSQSYEGLSALAAANPPALPQRSSTKYCVKVLA